MINVIRNKSFNGEWAPKISEEDWKAAKGRDRLLLAYSLSQRLKFDNDNGLSYLTGEFSECGYRIDGNKAVVTIKDYDEETKKQFQEK